MSGWSDLVTISDRFWSKVDDSAEDGCWPWLGSRSETGYGRFAYQRRTFAAHRVAYELAVGPIPTGLVMDHLCRNRACVNPAHLEPVTDRVNILRGVGLSAVNATKTECVNGHPLTPDNVHVRPASDERMCRTCARERHRRQYQVHADRNREAARRAYWADPERHRARKRKGSATPEEPSDD